MSELKNVFKFLKDYNEIRNPVITDIDEHSWYIDLLKLTENKEIFSAYRDENYDKLKILEVEKPHIEDDLSEAEVENLIEDLSNCNYPLSCPHGRPTFIVFDKNKLEKEFLRIK